MFRILVGRRDRILRRYLTRLSPLSHPVIAHTDRGAVLCLRDLLVETGLVDAADRWYERRAWLGDRLAATEPVGAAPRPGYPACTILPRSRGASEDQPQYMIVDVVGRGRDHDPQAPRRVHLYHLGGNDYRLVGLQRPEDASPPV